MAAKQTVHDEAKINVESIVYELKAVLELIDKMRNSKDVYAQFFDARQLSIAYTDIESAQYRLERAYTG